MIKGVATTAPRVLAVVIATLSATSAFAKNVTMLEAVPPGQAPSTHSPTEKSRGNASAREMKKARAGMIVNWRANPAKIRRGVANTREISAKEMVTPMPSMVTASAGVI